MSTVPCGDCNAFGRGSALSMDTRSEAQCGQRPPPSATALFSNAARSSSNIGATSRTTASTWFSKSRNVAPLSGTDSSAGIIWSNEADKAASTRARAC